MLSEKMIEERQTTVFNSHCDAIVNTVNCKGVMGAGLALEFRLRYPEMFLQYEEDCRNGVVRIGELRTYRVDDSTLIVNFPTKDHWKEPSEYWYIEEGLDYMMAHYREWNISSIALPPLGCSNGHLDLDIVRRIIKEKLKDIQIDVVICIGPDYPEGKEKEMVENYNKSNLMFVCDFLGITPKSKTILVSNGNIRRFYDIVSLDGVGLTTYEKLFGLFYRNDDKILEELRKKMTKSYNGSNHDSVCNELNIKGKMKKIILNHPKIESFEEISRIEGITNAVYRKLFDFFIDYEPKQTPNRVQSTLC